MCVCVCVCVGRRRVKARRPPQRPEGERDAGATAANPFSTLGSFVPSAAPKFSFGNLATTTSSAPLFSFKSATPSAAPPAAAAAADDTSAFDLEKALRESLQAIDPTLSATTSSISRLDRIIQSAARQIHEWAKANPDLTNPPASSDDPKEDESSSPSTNVAQSTGAETGVESSNSPAKNDAEKASKKKDSESKDTADTSTELKSEKE